MFSCSPDDKSMNSLEKQLRALFFTFSIYQDAISLVNLGNRKYASGYFSHVFIIISQELQEKTINLGSVMRGCDYYIIFQS